MKEKQTPFMIRALFIFLAFSASAMAGVHLPFTQALKQMLAQDVLIQKQRTLLAGSKVEKLAAIGRFLPQIQLQASDQASNSAAVVTDTGVQSVASTLQYSESATWNIFRGGSDIQGLRASSRDLAYQRNLLRQATLSEESACAKALLTLIESKKTLMVFQKAEANEQAYFQIAQKRYRRSLLSKQELDKVVLDLATSKSQTADAQTNRDRAQAQVAALLGSAGVDDLWPWNNRFAAPQVTQLLHLRKESSSLALRPDFRAARDLVKERRYLADQTELKLLPSIDLTYSLNQQRYSTGGGASGWSGMATVTMPLFEGFSSYSNYRLADEALLRAKFNLEQVQRRVSSNQAFAQRNFRVALKQFHERSTVLKTAKAIFAVDMARFKMGRASADDMKLDLERLTNSEILDIQGQDRIHLAYIKLLHAFGKRVLK